MAHTSPTAPRNSDPRRSLRLVRSGVGTPLSDGEAVRNSQALLGMKVVIASEVVLFAALIVAYLALRAQAAAWPPPGQPRLPVMVTGVNTLVLAAQRCHRLAGAARRARWTPRRQPPLAAGDVGVGCDLPARAGKRVGRG